MFFHKKENVQLKEQIETLSKQAKQQEEQIQVWASFKQSFPIAFFTINNAKEIIEHNRPLEKITGFNLEEIQGIKEAKYYGHLAPPSAKSVNLPVPI